MAPVSQLDKQIETGIEQGYGTISIRVVVLNKRPDSAEKTVEAPVDAAPEEQLPEDDRRPVSSFLEVPKRGKHVCVFLINGQRQHVWDNQFIVRDLELKYLRNRMLVVVECDGLRPEAIAELMQGSRHQFFEGKVYAALEARVIATLKGDPDLRRLEEEAEDDIASLQAGDEAVKAALDQLIDLHHEAADHSDQGQSEAGRASREETAGGSLDQTQTVVVQAQPTIGEPAEEPVLQIRPEVTTIRLKPNTQKGITIQSKPDSAWKSINGLTVTFDPPVKELAVVRSSQLTGEQVSLTFVEPSDFDQKEYPVETTLRATAMFKGFPDSRILERRVVITPPAKWKPTPEIPLKDDPTFVRVISRPPIRILVGGPDVHVKLRWDGNDYLTSSNPPTWTFAVTCESPTIEPQTFLTRPVNGVFELLIQASSGLRIGDQLKFDVEANGPGKSLSTAFLADVVALPEPRKIQEKVKGGSQRRPPYRLVYLTKPDWEKEELDCFGVRWSGAEAGAFDDPSSTSPLTIYINTDMDLLVSYRDILLAKKLTEVTIQQRVNKYTAHVAFHLYQMYQKSAASTSALESDEAPSDSQKRDEIRRVAHTLLRLMEVSQ